MTTLYRPLLIETAEQADALPSGTVATYGQGVTKLTAHRVGKAGRSLDAWMVMDEVVSHADMTGWTALVPIDVEVEHIRESGGRRRQKTLYVTPWETPARPGDEAQALADGGDRS